MKDVYYHMCKQKANSEDLYIWMGMSEGRVGPEPRPGINYVPSTSRIKLKLKEFLKKLDRQ